MADASGKEFARTQLEKYGWKQGKGLGKAEDGISKAIKVGIKNDTNGVGYDLGEQFTFHWWDHVFNKTAQSLVVEECKDGVKVSRDEQVTYKSLYNKKPNKHSGTPLLYGRFVKASSADQQPMSSDSESEEEDHSTQCPEEKLFNACGGRTAHKAARHGFKLNGKLLRLEEHERQTLSAASSQNNSPVVSDSEDKIADPTDSTKPPKATKSHKKKTPKKLNKLLEMEPVSELDNNSSLIWSDGDTGEKKVSKRKRKKTKYQDLASRDSDTGVYIQESQRSEKADPSQRVQECSNNRPKKSKKKRRKLKEDAVREKLSTDCLTADVVGGKRKKRKRKGRDSNVDT